MSCLIVVNDKTITDSFFTAFTEYSRYIFHCITIYCLAIYSATGVFYVFLSFDNQYHNRIDKNKLEKRKN